MNRICRFFFLITFSTLLILSKVFITEIYAAPTNDKKIEERNVMQLESLVNTLENETQRKNLVEKLKMLIAVQKNKNTEATNIGLTKKIFSALSDSLQKFVSEFQILSDGVALIPIKLSLFKDNFTNTDWKSENLIFLWKIIAAIFGALLVYYVVREVLGASRLRLETKETKFFWDRLLTILARLTIDLLPITALLLSGTILVEFLASSARVSNLGATIIRALFVAGILMVTSRLLLSPAMPDLRLLRLKDVDANYIFVWVRRLTYVGVYGFALVQIINHLGAPNEISTLLFKIVGLFFALMVSVLILQVRGTVADVIKGKKGEKKVLLVLRKRISSVWHILALFYLFALYFVWALQIENGAEFLLRGSVLTALILIFGYLSAVGLSQFTRKIFALRVEVKRRYPSLETRANMYSPFIQRAGNGLIFIIVCIFLLEAWGINAFSWIASAQGKDFINSFLTIALLIVITVIVWETSSALLERYLTSSEKVSARAKTLLPLLRTSLLVVLSTMIILVTLSELGLDIGPLLAGAGVVGLAIGFGAQTLVKDIITGIFILTEDQIAVGDVVRISSHSGMVEQLTLRTIRLRDLAGNVHIIPFSEVTTVENMTKDFSRYVFEVGIAYREDTDEVTEILYQIADELQADEEYGQLIVSPFEVMGVDSFGDNAVNIRARITTKPIQQWKVGREYNRRMKKRFDELGIEIPFPHRTIYFGVDREGNAPEGKISLTETKISRHPPPRGRSKQAYRNKSSVPSFNEDDGVLDGD